VPEALRERLQPGTACLCHSEKKTLVGVVVELPESAPDGTKIREIIRVLDFLPALTPKLIELAQWIAGYYLAPVGEVFSRDAAAGDRGEIAAPDYFDGGRA